MSLTLFSSVRSLSHFWHFATSWTAACQASLSFNHLLEFAQTHVHWVSDPTILSSVAPFCLLPSFFPSVKVFSNDLALHFRWPKYWNFSFSNRSSNEYSRLIYFRIDCFDLFAVQGTLKSSPTSQFKSINSSALSLLYVPTLKSIYDYWKDHSFD